jgi:2-oxoisovalerate dehydrogenase E1 component beta subunit
MSEINLIEAIRQGMDEEMARDPTVFITGEDVGPRGGVFRATQGLYEKYGDFRVIDSPLAELSIIGVGIGAAMNGLRPICEIQFADFIYPAFNQIASEAAKMYYRSNGQWRLPLIIRAPYGGGIGGGLYHSQSIEAFFTHIPGLKVVIPSTPYDAKGLLKSAIRDDNPVLFLEHKKAYRLLKGEVPGGEYTVPLGQAGVTRSGDDLSVYAYGLMHHFAHQAAEVVEREDGISVEIIDIRTLLPLDKATILESFKKTGKALIVYEDNEFMGYGAELAAILGSDGFEYMDGPITRLAGPNIPAMPFSHPMQEFFMVSPDKIVKAIRELAAY